MSHRPAKLSLSLSSHRLCGDDPDLVVAKNAAFDVLYGSARASLVAHRSGSVTDEDVRGLVLAGWSISHGSATLALTANLAEHLDTDTDALAVQITRGVITMGELARAATDPRH